MKKLLAIFLLLVLTVSMAACGGGGSNGGSGDGGKKEEDKICLGFNTNGLTNETMSFMADVMKKYCDEHGFDFMVAQDDGEISKMQNNLENMVAGGCDGIIFMNYDPPAMEKVVLELKEKGIKFVSYDEYSDVCDYCWHMSNYDTGYAIGQMGAEWVNKAIPEIKDVEIGFLSADTIQFMIDRGDGICDGFQDNCKNGCIVYRTPIANGDVLATYAGLLAAHPDIHVFTSIAGAAVTGVAESWYGDLTGQGKDISQYGVFSTDATDIELNLIYQAKQGKGVYRGTIDLGLKDRVPLGMITCCHKAILGEDPGYERVNYYEVKRVMEDNVDEYSQFLD